MLAINLCDEVELFSGSEAPNAQIYEGFRRTWLTDQVLNAYSEKFRIENGLVAAVKKNVPVAAGLGGGSSNAATALLAANLISGYPLTESELEGIACGVGSDVAFFLTGGCALVSGKGGNSRPRVPRPKRVDCLGESGH